MFQELYRNMTSDIVTAFQEFYRNKTSDIVTACFMNCNVTSLLIL